MTADRERPSRWDMPAHFVTWFGSPMLALTAALGRAALSAALASYFVRLLLDAWPLFRDGLLPALPGPPPLLLALWLGGLSACCGAAVQWAPRLCAAAAAAAVVASRPSLGPVAFLEDHVALWLAVWLLLLPLPLRGRGAQVPGGVARLLLVSASLLYAQPLLWRANLPDFQFERFEPLLLASAPLLALGRRTQLAGLLLLACGHVLLVAQGRLQWVHLALLATAPFYLDGWLSAARRASEPRQPSRFDGATGAALALVLVTATATRGQPLGAKAAGTATALLDTFGLLPPRARAGRAAAVGPLHLVLVDAQGRAVPGGPLTDARPRSALFATYFARESWLVADRERIAARARGALAAAVCAQRSGSFTYRFERSREASSNARDEHALSFDCGPGGARLLASARYEGSLLTAQDPAFHAPERIPSSGDPSAFAGSASCAACHGAAHAAWAASDHALGLRASDPAIVRGAFDGRTAGSPGAVVKPLREGSAFFMELSGVTTTRYQVAHVLGSGASLQAYFADGPDGPLLLPLLWSGARQDWAPVSELQPELYEPGRPAWTQVITIEAARCAQCHMTAPSVHAGAAKAAFEWTEAGVGCEACHGPARAHLTHQRDRRPGLDAYVVAQGPAQAAAKARCGACHGPSDERALWEQHGDRGEGMGGSLEHGAVLANGVSLSGKYQLPAFAMSACRRAGGATCSHCHAAHAKEQPSADAACTACHTPLAAEPAQMAHSRHSSSVRCVDCHMPRADALSTRPLERPPTRHDLQPPRPDEDALLGLSSACSRCHAEQSTGAAVATLAAAGAPRGGEVRPWVRELLAWKRSALTSRREVTFDSARELLSDETRQELIVGALRLLARARENAALRDRLLALTAHERPEVRAAAALAGARHDPDAATVWLRRAAGDPNPIVRMPAFARLLDLRAMDESDQREYLHDLMTDAALSPTREIQRLARLRNEAGDAHEALALLELAQRYAEGPQRQQLAAEIARLRADLAVR